jgi:hypothetical protein
MARAMAAKTHAQITWLLVGPVSNVFAVGGNGGGEALSFAPETARNATHELRQEHCRGLQVYPGSGTVLDNLGRNCGGGYHRLLTRSYSHISPEVKVVLLFVIRVGFVVRTFG